eukprot:COSAG01_NODE_20035_length_974_cov_72.308571_2_plen_125_part_01
MISEEIFELKRKSKHQSRLAKPWCLPLSAVSFKTRNPIETTNFDDSNLKYVIGVGDFANVTKQNLKDPEKMLAPAVDNQSTFSSACVVKPQLWMARSTTRMQPWKIFCDLHLLVKNDLSRPRPSW